MAISFSRGSSRPRDWTRSPALQADSLPTELWACFPTSKSCFVIWRNMSKPYCCCSVAKSYLTVCNPMNYSTPGFPILTISGSLLRLMFIELMMPSNHLILCHPFSFCPQSFPALGSFPMSQLFPSGGQNTGASASASVLSMNIQGWFPLGLTGLISLQSKGLSRVFCSTTIQKHQFFGTQPSLSVMNYTEHNVSLLIYSFLLKIG